MSNNSSTSNTNLLNRAVSGARNTFQNLYTSFNAALNNIMSHETSDSTTLSTTQVSDDIQADTLLDLSFIEEALPHDVVKIIHSYISVECIALVSRRGVIRRGEDNENRIILTAQCPDDVVRIKSVDTYVM